MMAGWRFIIFNIAEISKSKPVIPKHDSILCSYRMILSFAWRLMAISIEVRHFIIDGSSWLERQLLVIDSIP